MLRHVKTKRVAIPALCDNLLLYARTLTYFTPFEYGRYRGREILIRKCDVAIGSNTAGVGKNGVICVNEQEKTVYRGVKEYQQSYIWGQLIGWYKQTVDKPNASLSADRRGTLTLPDLDSFIITAKNQENLTKGVTKRKRGAAGHHGKDSSEGDYDEVMPTAPSRSRGGIKDRRAEQSGRTSESKSKQVQYSVPEGSEVKMAYPNKKFQVSVTLLY